MLPNPRFYAVPPVATETAERDVVSDPSKPVAAHAAAAPVTPSCRAQSRPARDGLVRLDRSEQSALVVAPTVRHPVGRSHSTALAAVSGHAASSLEPASRTSRSTRRHLWLPTTRDDSVLRNAFKFKDSGNDAGKELEEEADESHWDRSNVSAVEAFFVARVTDPTSYFYRFHDDDYRRQLCPRKADVQLVDLAWLKPHEQIVSWARVNGLRKATLTWDAYTEPLLVDSRTGAILDGHHRYNVALQLRLKQVPAVLVDYVGDKTIEVDVWPGCGRLQLRKEEVIAMALSSDVFPPKTSRHRLTESLPPISIPLSVLRQPPVPVAAVVARAATTSMLSGGMQAITLHLLERRQRLQRVSVSLICGAQNLATSVTKSLFRGRLRAQDHVRYSTQMDLIIKPLFDTKDFFNAIRENDLTSSFCQHKAATLEDLLSDDIKRRQKFLLTRITDPTSYFYKYHFDVHPPRQPKRSLIHLASLQWLKPHEHVVSWERVDGLRRATISWNAYLEPLLVDRVTGAILDGHHRYNVGIQLELQCVPVVLVDYLEDETITVDVWPACGRDSLTKQEVIDVSLSDDLFPPKTSRHSFSNDLPPISVPLERLRTPLESTYVLM
ncbi:unnamed protein product [Hyaloperonospora brassicae]|uniref:ParB-like N-terminal domain-containing protein n=1 Tax=Hyaloperonospora brassicae TaxID=162125 RepID=A0AAV0UKG0_HYABA|nr:unnamed protein product [Hyaloperonospora brassicae]